MAHVFISYSTKDTTEADTIRQYLEEHGINCWIAHRNAVPGEEWDKSIIEAIETSNCIILVFSSRSDISSNVKTEISIALNKEIVLVPFRIENVEPSGLLYFLHTTHWLDAFAPPLEHHLPLLLETVTHHVSNLQKKPSVNRLTAKIEATPKKTIYNSLDMKFVLIPSGIFQMGSNIRPEETAKRYGKADNYKIEHPQHQVTISRPFYLQTTPVTQRQFEQVMGKNPSMGKIGFFSGAYKDHPVEMVSWFDAQEFLSKLNWIEKNNIYRLPTEAEWEYACRAGSVTSFCFGEDKGLLKEYGMWSKKLYELSQFGDFLGDMARGVCCTRPVGRLKPNVWGLYDMHGHICEWCQDWLGWYPKGPIIDPKGPSSGEVRVTRGGSFGTSVGQVRSASRNGADPNCRDHHIGFRVAKTL